MGACKDCGKSTCTRYGKYNGEYLCDECLDKRDELWVLEKSKTLKEISDFQTWDSGDMSELFWIHLGRYAKEPNPDSLNYMYMAFLWACHDNHGISNSFSHALKWAGIDLFAERRKWKDKKIG